MKKKICVLFLCVLSAACFARATSLIVFKDGVSAWASSVRQEGDVVRYTDRNSGEEKAVKIAELSGVVRTVNRGGQYSPDQVQKYIDQITKLQRVHSKLYRQLNSIKQEWEVFQKPVEGLDEDIERLAGEFRSGDKSTGMYKKTVLDLGMVKYKDLQGKYATRIDNLLAEIKGDFVKTNMERLSMTSADAEGLSPDDFLAFEQLAKDVIHEADAEVKETVAGQLEQTRAKVYESLSRAGYQALLKGNKSVDAYLESARILLSVKEKVAVSKEDKDLTDKRMKSLIDMVSQSQSGYNFEQNGFPLDAEDRQLLSRLGGSASRVTFTSLDLNEQALVIAGSKPEVIKLHRPFSVPLRVVINRGQPADRVFGMMVKIFGPAETYTHIVDVGKLKFTNGRANFTFRENFTDTTEGFVAGPDEYGHYNFYCYLVYSAVVHGVEEWIPLSKACAWPYAP